MTAAKYQRPHQRERERWRPVVDAGEAYCVERICIVERDGGTRWIAPGTPWDLCHDLSGTVWIGPGHARCNRSEAATRGNRMRAAKAPRWVL